jgi:uncharacterized protein (TIGR02145 family)
MKRMVVLLLFVICFLTNYGQQTGTFSDPRDGKVYKTVKIGNQKWLAQNLAFKADSGCWAYNNDKKNVAVYGYLYTYEVAKKACPAGWHLPTNNEWTTLIKYKGGDTIAGGKLKEEGTAHWSISDKGNTNESGFTALPGGCRKIDGSFFAIGNYGNWWSSTEYLTAGVWVLYMACSNSLIGRDYSSKTYGLSVRCIRDY